MTKKAFNVYTDRTNSGFFDWRAYVVTDCKEAQDIAAEIAATDNLPVCTVMVRPAKLAA